MGGLTGTPGTGKSSVGAALASLGWEVYPLTPTFSGYELGQDPDRDTTIVDEERWAADYPRVEGIVEGHLAHLLPCDLVVILRCRPDVLCDRLRSRGYPPAKVTENCEAEALDVILVETLDLHSAAHVLEIDTTALTAEEAAHTANAFFRGEISPSHGTLDWSSFMETCNDP